MRIVYVTSALPFPPRNGGAVKTHATLSGLIKERHDVHLFCFGPKNSKRSIEELVDLGVQSVYCQPRELAYEKALFVHGTFFLRSLVRGSPYTLEKFFSKSLKRAVDAFCDRTKPDVVWIDHFNLIPYVPDFYDRKTVLEEHNIQSVLFARLAQSDRNPLRRYVYSLESYKWRRFEKEHLALFSVIAAISDPDKRYLEKHYGLSTVLPFGTAVSISKKRARRKKQFLFVGRLTWQPNTLGLNWFLEHVWPEVRQRFPDHRLVVVGDYVRKPKPVSGVTFVGQAPAIEPFFLESQAFVCPIFAGSGIRIKILQALSYGLPVVSTRLGAEGLPVEHGKSILLADTARAFGEAIEHLVTNKKLQAQLARNGRTEINTHYSPSVFQKRIHEILK